MMKEMIYYGFRSREAIECIADGELEGYRYYVLNLGSHPCAYVELPDSDKYYHADYYDIPVDCHGGLTYGHNSLHTVDHIGWFIGWDYSHFGDYMKMNMYEHEGRKYTTEEMVEECKDVIRQLIELNKE